jgi:hypothetical protein
MKKIGKRKIEEENKMDIISSHDDITLLLLFAVIMLM